jgi:hypothetical protein
MIQNLPQIDKLEAVMRQMERSPRVLQSALVHWLVGQCHPQVQQRAHALELERSHSLITARRPMHIPHSLRYAKQLAQLISLV